MILHECDRCGELSDNKKAAHAQNKYEDWIKLTILNVASPEYGDEIEQVMELCVTCKKSIRAWSKASN